MRVYQLNTFCGIKSTGRIAWEICKLVLQDGGDVRFGFGSEEPSSEAAPYAYRTAGKLDRKVHGAIRKLLDGEGYGSLLATRALIRDIKAFQPDLIHLHNIHGAYLHLPALFRYFATVDIPIVWTLHDCWPFTGHCAYFDASGCDRWLTECHHCPSLAQYPICQGLDGSRRNHRMKKKVLSKPRNMTFVVPCQWLQGYLVRSHLGHYPCRVIYNGVNLSQFRPVASDLRQRYNIGDRKIVLSVASDWDERKGLPYLEEAARQLGRDYCFVVIGLSEQQVAALPEGMLGLTHTANVEELAAWYSAADCFANPTLEDNMPMVNLEALACGTPIAVFATGGCPEAVTEECGIVIPKGDQQGFCDAIQKLCRESAERKNACLERSKAFDCDLTFRSYLSLYKELCQ